MTASSARVHRNPGKSIPAPLPLPAGGPRRFHRTMPGYEVTPLVRLDHVARRTGVAEVWVKDESSRLGLPSFKILGGSWAVHRLVSAKVDRPAGAMGFDELRESARSLEMTLCAATDGNHGRGVARMARLLGFDAVIYVPDDMTPARVASIRSEGAAVRVIRGGYDDAVALAARDAAAHGWDVVADVTYEDDIEAPRWVMEGYDTILAECDEQLEAAPTAVIVQAGVGALAGAVLSHYVERRERVRFGIVEPITAACLLESAVKGRPVALESTYGSEMVGLNCGTPSLIAWPIVHSAADVFLAIGDESAFEAMRLFADAGVVAGESGAAGLGGLLEATRSPEAATALGLDDRARVLLINTEGATDLERYQAVVDTSR